MSDLAILDCSAIANRITQLCASSLCEDVVIEYSHAIKSILASLSFDMHEVFPDDYDAYGVTQHRLLSELNKYVQPYRDMKPNMIYCELRLKDIDGCTAVYEVAHMDLRDV